MVANAQLVHFERRL